MQGNLFKNIGNRVANHKLKIQENPSGWQDLFYNEMTLQIGGDVFTVLYLKGNGRSKANILKKGSGWCNKKLLTERTHEDQSISANFEASIDQVFHRLGKNEEVRCCGSYQNYYYVVLRAMQTNFRRIQKKTAKYSPAFDYWGLWYSVRAQVLTLFDGKGMIIDYKNYSQSLA